MKSSTEENYIERIDRVIQFLNKQVDNTPSLEKLADVAAISPFHFQRIYRAVTGESPAQTIRRLRLAKACVILQASKNTITDIAFAVGYDSSQAFAKALRETTGFTATELRSQPEILVSLIDTLSNSPVRESSSDKILEVKLVSIDPFKVIAHRHVGPADALFQAFGFLFNWVEEKGFAGNMMGIYGIPIDDSRDVELDEYRFDCCFNLGEDAVAEDVFREEWLGGGLFAVTRHTGPYEGLHEKYDYLYGVWLNSSDFSLREHAVYNHYLSDPDTLPPAEWQTDIYLPVQKK